MGEATEELKWIKLLVLGYSIEDQKLHVVHSKISPPYQLGFGLEKPSPARIPPPN